MKSPPALRSPRPDPALWLGRWATAALRLLPPESAHALGLACLAQRWVGYLPRPRLASLPVGVGLQTSLGPLGELAHPIGLAAGFDKDARAPQGCKDLGFAFLEVGTITPQPQAGNHKPRLFRQQEQLALINRMGFNNGGSAAVSQRLRSYAWDHEAAPLGVNVGKNKNTSPANAMADYLQVLRSFADLGRYFVVNVSSPNTQGLRELANKDFLAELARGIALEAPEMLARTFVKLDPDMAKKPFQEVVAAVAASGYGGLIVSNTHRVVHPQAGGQSGHPLAIQATQCLEWAYEVHQGLLPMIGCGGIMSGGDIYQKLIRGAAAVQIYTALIYRGPWAVWELLAELAAELQLRGFVHLSDAISTFYDDPEVARSLL